MSRRSPLRIPISLVVMAALGWAFWSTYPGGAGSVGKDAVPSEECEGLADEDCPALLSGAEAVHDLEDAGAFLTAQEACVDVGYLCAEVWAQGSLRLLRWPMETSRIRIRVPEPEGLSPALAREFQRAAARGIRAWDGHPIPLSVSTRAREEDADISVEWARRVEDGRLGRARVEWTRTGGKIRFRVGGFTIATHNPMDEREALSPRQIELVAAHEMGHSLGLPHSDNPQDVMFPTNTAVRLTTRDFRTLEAIYALPNGIEIRR